MNVKTKMKLMLVMDSYWDMLPPEIHETIMMYKRNQELIDEEKKERMREVCNEIVKYGELKRKWEIGHVKCIVNHLKIMGCYVDEEKIPKERFLGYNFKSALERVNHVKSFM